MPGSALISLYPNAWLRLQQHVEQLTRETGLEFELGELFIKREHLVGSYTAIDGRQRAQFFASTPLDTNRPNRLRWWSRQPAA